MKLYAKGGEEVIVTWSDHWPACGNCREVTITQSATFARACAMGAPLLMEELARRQAPIVKQKTAEVRKWAEHTGIFKMGKSKFVPMKYKEVASNE